MSDVVRPALPGIIQLVQEFIPGLILTESQAEALIRYEELVAKRSVEMNLVARNDCAALRTRHVLDSMAPLKHNLDWSNRTLIDIGAGAGFPGIVLHITAQPMKTTLVESREKRAVFLREVISALGLKSIEVYPGRSEDAAHDEGFREKYDIAVSRAVGSLPEVIELCLPLIKVEGTLYVYKTESGLEGEKDPGTALSALGGNIRVRTQYRLPDEDSDRLIVSITKTHPSDERFPRRIGKSKKSPL